LKSHLVESEPEVCEVVTVQHKAVRRTATGMLSIEFEVPSLSPVHALHGHSTVFAVG
jgi:hypothetical protein